MQHEALIGLGLHDVAEAAELVLVGEKLQALADLGVAQVNPAYDSADERIFGGQVEEKERFFF